MSALSHFLSVLFRECSSRSIIPIYIWPEQWCLPSLIGALLLVTAGVLMFVLHNNEWMAVMFAGALMELYTAFRIPAEMEKHK